MLNVFAIWLTEPGPALLWTAVGFLSGALISHFLTVRWDRTKEFNTLAAPVRTQLRRELGDLRANAQWADLDALDQLVDIAPFYKSKALRAGIDAYKNARREHVRKDPAGHIFFTQTDHVASAISQLLKLLRHR